jgi:uncharacterized phiE125 gp8 family phage protein
MTTQRISAPVALAVSLAEAKQTLRIDDDDASMDGQIAVWIAGITAEAEHQTGRAFVNRSMRVTLDAFPDAIKLSAPTFSVEAVRFQDADGVTRTLDPADYYADRVTVPGYVVPARGKAWPVTDAQVNAVSVDYTAGYGPAAADVPEEARLYILGRLSELFDPAAREFKETQASSFLCRLLDSLKVYSI